MRNFTIIIFVLINSFFSCKTPKEKDEPYNGILNIYIDENFRAVMEEQIKVFTMSYPKVSVNATYTDQNTCIDKLMKDSTRMIISPRILNAEEEKYCNDHIPRIYYENTALARDAVALIVAKSSNKKHLTNKEVISILKGTSNEKQTIVFDKSTSSNLQFMIDSVLRGAKLGSNVFAAGSIEKVIDYVAQNSNAIGILSATNFADRDNIKTKEYLSKVDFVEVKKDSSKYYFPPLQMYIGSKDYPYIRNLYFILNEPWQGVGSSFANFLGKNRGQLLFKEYYLFPLLLNVAFRDVEIIKKKDIFN